MKRCPAVERNVSRDRFGQEPNPRALFKPGSQAFPKAGSVSRADAGFTLSRATLDSILARQTTFPNAIKAGDIKVEGEAGKLGELIEMLDEITQSSSAKSSPMLSASDSSDKYFVTIGKE
jgi:hypothetical protein